MVADCVAATVVLTYRDVRKFDDRLRNIETLVQQIVTDKAELNALRVEVASLTASNKITAEELAALNARVAAVRDRAQALVTKEQAVATPTT